MFYCIYGYNVKDAIYENIIIYIQVCDKMNGVQQGGREVNWASFKHY